MTSLRKTALVAGIFYLITFISIPTLALYGPVKNHRDWILSSGSHTGVLLVPRIIPVVGLIGGPLLIIAVFATLFGGGGGGQALHGLAVLSVLPVAAWELSLGVWLVVKGFNPSPITTGMNGVNNA
jgi:Domain of unknown function (DUF4386)